jgi:hypothetical protein
MRDEFSKQPGRTVQPPQFNASNRWPWILGVMTLAFCHVSFFLPLRIFIPFPAWTDPWWGISLIVVDGAVCVFLIRHGFKKLTRMDAQKEDD